MCLNSTLTLLAYAKDNVINERLDQAIKDIELLERIVRDTVTIMKTWEESPESYQANFAHIANGKADKNTDSKHEKKG